MLPCNSPVHGSYSTSAAECLPLRPKKDLAYFFYWQNLPASLSWENYLPPHHLIRMGSPCTVVYLPSVGTDGQLGSCLRFYIQMLGEKCSEACSFQDGGQRRSGANPPLPPLWKKGIKTRKQRKQEWEKSTQEYWQKLSFKFPSHTNQVWLEASHLLKVNMLVFCRLQKKGSWLKQYLTQYINLL